ncbi:tyrosine-protein phosphatase [Paenibacillus ferrarius]|uniref:tyrosine-protein phosphatase n=1 Tax=Paenibacillus ferrarius TaxID=1469647 RepID=UPI001FC9CDD6|nr:tyrosine-protein phosphatase [Paenibacillus ferrarius]
MQRIIPFEGTNNFRDMGGYRTIDGRQVKYRLFYRSDELTGLTEKDLESLRALNIRTIFDYRDDYEAQKKPDPVIHDVINIRIPAIEAHQRPRMNVPSDSESDSSKNPFFIDLIKSGFFKSFRADTTMIDLYTKFPINNPSYKRLMATIQNTDNLGLLHHCTAGKDRTGVGAALILMALGVPESTVMEDYLLTNVTMKEFNRNLLDRLAEHADEAELQNIVLMLEIKEAYMDAALGSIKKTYGDYNTYFYEEFGLTKSKRETLQNMCLT